MPIGGLGADDLDGGAGLDRVDYSQSASAVNVTLDDLPFDGAAGEGDNVRTSVENVTGSPFGDVLRSLTTDATANASTAAAVTTRSMVVGARTSSTAVPVTITCAARTVRTC